MERWFDGSRSLGCSDGAGVWAGTGRGKVEASGISVSNEDGKNQVQLTRQSSYFGSGAVVPQGAAALRILHALFFLGIRRRPRGNVHLRLET